MPTKRDLIQQVGLASCKTTVILTSALMGYLPCPDSAQASSAVSATLQGSCRQTGNHLPLLQLLTNQNDMKNFGISELVDEDERWDSSVVFQKNMTWHLVQQLWLSD